MKPLARLLPRVFPAAIGRLAFCLIVACLLARAVHAGDDPALLYTAGRYEEALRAANVLLADDANDRVGLYYNGLVNIRLGRNDVALARTRRLTRLFPGMIGGWELLVELYQMAGDLERRDSALWELRAAYRTVDDPLKLARLFFNRDRIVANGRILIGREVFEGNGGDMVRYIFVPEDEPEPPIHYITLSTDAETTRAWQDVGASGDSKRVFHLDTVSDNPDQEALQQTYELYIDEPIYDVVRAKVIEILNGKALPYATEPDRFWAMPASPAKG